MFGGLSIRAWSYSAPSRTISSRLSRSSRPISESTSRPQATSAPARSIVVVDFPTSPFCIPMSSRFTGDHPRWPVSAWFVPSVSYVVDDSYKRSMFDSVH